MTALTAEGYCVAWESVRDGKRDAMVSRADTSMPLEWAVVVTIHENILSLSAVVCAAVGKFPGVTPEEMLAEITRHSRFTAEEFAGLATEEPIDVPALHGRIRHMLDQAETFITALPSDAVGIVFMDGERPVQPIPGALDRYRRHRGAPGGLWPSSSDISRAILERYNGGR